MKIIFTKGIMNQTEHVDSVCCVISFDDKDIHLVIDNECLIVETVCEGEISSSIVYGIEDLQSE